MNSPRSKPKGEQVILSAGLVALGFVLRDLLKSKPSYASFEGKITPHNQTVRKTGIKIARQHAGSYNLGQVFDIFDWAQTNLKYVSDPEPDHIAYPEETILAGGGDCDEAGRPDAERGGPDWRFCGAVGESEYPEVGQFWN